jgi:serine/threonine protein kinase
MAKRKHGLDYLHKLIENAEKEAKLESSKNISVETKLGGLIADVTKVSVNATKVSRELKTPESKTPEIRIPIFIKAGTFGQVHDLGGNKVSKTSPFIYRDGNTDEFGNTTLNSSAIRELVVLSSFAFTPKLYSVDLIDDRKSVSQLPVTNEVSTGEKPCVSKFISIGPSRIRLIMQHTGIDLTRFRRYGQLSNTKIIKIAYQLLQYLKVMKRHNIIHADIKPCNITIDTETEKISLVDFGAVNIRGDCKKRDGHARFSIGFKAPEVANGNWSFSADMFSVGQTLLFLKVGNYIRNTGARMDMITPSPLKSLIMQMIRVRGATNRITVEEALKLKLFDGIRSSVPTPAKSVDTDLQERAQVRKRAQTYLDSSSVRENPTRKDVLKFITKHVTLDNKISELEKKNISLYTMYLLDMFVYYSGIYRVKDMKTEVDGPMKTEVDEGKNRKNCSAQYQSEDFETLKLLSCCGYLISRSIIYCMDTYLENIHKHFPIDPSMVHMIPLAICDIIEVVGKNKSLYISKEFIVANY